jgi:glycosyltransferase involved in cell wall biosynthesis
MISGRDIVILSAIEWHELWQGPQELASRLAANGNRVLYVENIGARAPRWSDRARIATRLRSWSRGLRGHGTRRVADGLWVMAPLVAPPFGGGPARTLNRRVLIPAIARAVGRLGLRDPVLWTYLPTDTARQVIARLRTPASALVYSCVADFAQRTPDADALARSEAALLRDCDVVFALPGLVERCARHSDRVLVDGPAVDTERFDPAADHARPRELHDLPGPVIGYVGGLQRNLDLVLLEALARERPQWTWIFVGPVYCPVGGLARPANVRIVGAVARDHVPGAIAACDVCISPLLIDAYTASMVPTKIGEYLAMGKPVVATPIAYAVQLARESDGVVSTAEPQAGPFLEALERALLLARDERTAVRSRALATERAWSRRIEEMSAALVAGAGWAQAASQQGEETARVAGAR